MAFQITAATESWPERIAFEPIPFTYNGERTTIIVSSRDAVGHGATATVLKGTLYQSTGIKTVALKVHGAILTDRQRLILHREMEVWRMVAHPRILPFYGTCDISTNQLALVSPYMDNGNLCEYIARNNVCDRLQLIHQVAEGLHYLHRSGFVHGDIKSVRALESDARRQIKSLVEQENVLVDSDGKAVIADFGLSTSVYSMSEDAPTATFIRERKTVKFSAPELFLDEAVDHEITYRVRSKTRMSDVYGFGALIYQVYSGSPPWHSLNDRNVVLRVCRRDRPDRPPHHHLTDEIWDLCHRCWKHIPGDRPAMYTVLLELTALVNNSQGQAQYPVMSPGPHRSHMVAVAGSSLSTAVAGVPLPSASSGAFRNEMVAAAYADQQRPPYVPHAPPNYQTALSRSPSENDSFYTIATDPRQYIRRPSQRRFDVQYTPVVEFLQYINELPGAKQRNLVQYAPTFKAQHYYTIDDLRDVSQPELCEDIPGLTRGNGDYICEMIRAELLRIDRVDEQSQSQSQSQSQRSNQGGLGSNSDDIGSVYTLSPW